MFKQLKYKVFAIYFLSILIILVGSLTFVYARSVDEMESSIGQRLEGTKKEPEGKEHGSEALSNAIPSETPKLEEAENSIPDINVDEARDLTIAEDENFMTKLNNYLGDSYAIDYDKQVITAGYDTYVYKEVDNAYKLVKVTYDLEYIDSLQTTLMIFGLLVVVIFSIVGYILITKLIEPIKESYETQNRFVSDASHELKTPLAIIKSCLDLIAKGDNEEELVTYCQGETDRLIRLTNNLLQLSEHSVRDYELINLSKSIELLISGVEVGLFEKKIKLSSDIETDINARIANDDINQLLHILIDNGVKYNDDRRRLKVVLRKISKHIYLEVENTSNVVEEEQLEQLFDRFYRTDKSRSEKGFGLGLSIAKHITEKYNGDIQASYGSGKFKVTIKFPAN